MGAAPALESPQPPKAGQPPAGTRAFVCGLETFDLTDFERTYLRETQPWGVILFGRNISHPDQVKRLTDDVRDVLGWYAPVLIDQEGGRVQRLKPPHWRRYPAASRYGQLEASESGAGVEAAQIAAWMMADDLLNLGINVNCAPVLDLRITGGTDAIGNRAIHDDAKVVSIVGRAIMEAFRQAGVVPVIKHIPGHGRAQVDSHLDLPRITEDRAVLDQSDFIPFRALADAPLAMTGHLVFDALDPDEAATHSKAVIDLIRQSIGFTGALLTDDLSMGALSGTLAQRAANALNAGCDIVLHCNGSRHEMEAIRPAVPTLQGKAAARCAAALANVGQQTLDRARLGERLDTLLAKIDEDAIAADPTRVSLVG